MDHSMSMSMENAFYSSSQFVDLLFKGFTITSLPGFIGVLVGIVSISILYEGLRQVRDYFLNRFADTRKQAFIYQQQQPSTTVNVQPRRRKNSNGSGSSTKRCDSIRYFNINKRSPIDDIGQDEDQVHTVGPGGDAATHPTRVMMNPDRDASPEPGPSSSLVPPQGLAPVTNVRVRVEDLALATLLHMIYITIGYMLMLAVMTFNVWILVSVTLGVGIGYLIFGTFRRLDHLATHKRIEIIECCEDGGGDRVAVGKSNRSGRRSTRDDSAGPEGPLLRSGSNSVTSSQASDAAAGYGATTQEKTSTARHDEEEEIADTECRTLIIHQVHDHGLHGPGH